LIADRSKLAGKVTIDPETDAVEIVGLVSIPVEWNVPSTGIVISGRDEAGRYVLNAYAPSLLVAEARARQAATCFRDRRAALAGATGR
jgi:hypothetical protein